jgi:hypothetical protein
MPLRARDMQPGIIDCVLNGIALLFIVEFDEKLFKLLVNKSHKQHLMKEITESQNIEDVRTRGQQRRAWLASLPECAAQAVCVAQALKLAVCACKRQTGV